MQTSFLLLTVLASISASFVQGLNPTCLRCEDNERPVSDVIRPRLSWVVSSKESNQVQTAYQVLVAQTEQNLTESKADLWNSGKVNDRTTYQIA